MDSQNYIIYLYSLILCIFPNVLDTQRITCPTPCDIGYTCAMVRHGTQPSSPGCITMQEAILLHQAMNGGPSGPGTGMTTQVGPGVPQQNAGVSFPQSPNPGDPIPPFPQTSAGAIPGMSFLGSTDPQQPGFEQRFAQGLGRPPRNFGIGMTGQVNGQFGSPQIPTGMAGPAFLDPTAGQFGRQPSGQFARPATGQFDPNAGQFGPNGGQFVPGIGQFGGQTPGQIGGQIPGQFGPPAGPFGPRGPTGFTPQVDGGHNNFSSASGIRDNTNLVWHGSRHGGGNFPRPGISGRSTGLFGQRTNLVDQTSDKTGRFGPSARNLGRPRTFDSQSDRPSMWPTTGRLDPNTNQIDTVGIESPPIGFIPEVLDLSNIPTSPVSRNRDNTNQFRNDFSQTGQEGSNSPFDRFGQTTDGFGPIASPLDPTAGQFGQQPRQDSPVSGSTFFHDQRNEGFQGEQPNSGLTFVPQTTSQPVQIVEENLLNIPDGFVGDSSPHANFISFVDIPPIVNVPEQGIRVRSDIANQIPLGTRVGSTEPKQNLENAPMLVNLDGINSASLETNSAEQSQSKVSSIREDSAGLHYVFYPRSNGAGFRVNITKDGFCPRDSMTRGRSICMNSCYSDDRCPLEQKCCPSGCSLNCRDPNIPNKDINSQPQGTRSNSVPDSNAASMHTTCKGCEKKEDCPSGQYCYLSYACAKQISCLNRNYWCPEGYVCRRQPTGTPGQFEDACVLPQRQRPVRTSTGLSRLQPIGSGRSSTRSRNSPSKAQERSSPRVPSNFPNRNRDNLQNQVSLEPRIPTSWRQVTQLPRSNDIQNLRNSPQPDIVKEQSLDVIRPGLLKKNGVQRQSLTRNRSIDSLTVPSRDQDTRRISEATSPFRELNSTTSKQSDTTNKKSNTKECIPCKNHSDCNDIFTYCINKTPCVGQVCYKVT